MGSSDVLNTSKIDAEIHADSMASLLNKFFVNLSG